LILKYIDSFRSYDEYPFIVTELASGGSLEKLVGRFVYPPRRKKFLPSEIIDVALHVGLALKHLHRNNIIYRDLKLENVFIFKITPDYSIYKLGDFGISKDILKEVSRTMKSYFVTDYLAPEVLEGKPKTFKNDAWALGILIYMLCSTGNHPFYEYDTLEKNKL